MGGFQTDWNYLVKRVDLPGNTENELDHFTIPLVLLATILDLDLLLTELN